MGLAHTMLEQTLAGRYAHSLGLVAWHGEMVRFETGSRCVSSM